jgi:uncharacterized membrane protein
VIQIKARLTYVAVVGALVAQAVVGAFGGVRFGFFDG